LAHQELFFKPCTHQELFLRPVSLKSANWLTRSSFLSPRSPGSAWGTYWVSWACAACLREYFSHVRIFVTSWGMLGGAMKSPGAPKPLPELGAPSTPSLAPSTPGPFDPFTGPFTSPQALPGIRDLFTRLFNPPGAPSPSRYRGPLAGPLGSSRSPIPGWRGCKYVAGWEKLPGAGEGSGD